MCQNNVFSNEGHIFDTWLTHGLVNSPLPIPCLTPKFRGLDDSGVFLFLSYETNRTRFGITIYRQIRLLLGILCSSTDQLLRSIPPATRNDGTL